MTDIGNRIDGAYAILEDAVTKYNLKSVAALFSGGHDSVLTSYITSKHPLFSGLVYANTLTGSKQTREYIYKIRDDYHWTLFEGKPNLITYEMLLIRYGYPSPVTHQMMYRHLKDRTIDRLRGVVARSAHCQNSEVGYTSGIRKWESRKRMITAAPVKIQWLDKAQTKIKRMFISPCYDFTQDEREEAIAYLGIPRNPFADYMRNSYECQCGSNMDRDERARRNILAPQYEEIEQKREHLVQTAYELQELMVKYGVIDREDATLEPDKLKWGWHTTAKFKAEDFEIIDDEFSLCQSCIGKRSYDGSAAIDIDKPLLNNLIPNLTFSEGIEVDVDKIANAEYDLIDN